LLESRQDSANLPDGVPRFPCQKRDPGVDVVPFVVRVISHGHEYPGLVVRQVELPHQTHLLRAHCKLSGEMHNRRIPTHAMARRDPPAPE
jgi:hypothetical protein